MRLEACLCSLERPILTKSCVSGSRLKDNFSNSILHTSNRVGALQFYENAVDQDEGSLAYLIQDGYPEYQVISVELE